MENKHIFNSYGFNLALAILLLNDFILKDIYGSWLTGKLSDFAGLFVFSLFFIAVFPKYRQVVLYATGILFIFWKSPFSQPIINFWNHLSIFSIHRVVDYTDFFALLMLPLAGLFSKIVPKAPELKFNPILPMLVACFAFVATSRGKDFGFKVEKIYTYSLSKDTLIARMNSRLDSLNHVLRLDSLGEHSGKVYFFIPLDFYGEPILEISVQERSASETEVELIGIDLSRLIEEKDQKALIEEVEQKILNRLN
ncbi:hypothetical protein [Haliscomenobacter sp.]|uniref:hypothetical protein n=1 Tax=Haliscomenobacter sp. TaxID=2717303 RepID=UPI00359406CF